MTFRRAIFAFAVATRRVSLFAASFGRTCLIHLYAHLFYGFRANAARLDRIIDLDFRAILVEFAREMCAPTPRVPRCDIGISRRALQSAKCRALRREIYANSSRGNNILLAFVNVTSLQNNKVEKYSFKANFKKNLFKKIQNNLKNCCVYK